MKFVRFIIFTLIFTHCPGILAEDSPGLDMQTLTHLTNLIRWEGVVYSIIFIMIAFLFMRVMHNTVTKISTQFPQRRLVLQKLETLARFIIYVVITVGTFSLSIDVDNTVLTLIGGALAFSVGFALKDLVASFIAGIMVMIDRPFQVGDRVAFGGQYGDIISIGLRSVRMNTLDDDVVTIPNNQFLNEITKSGNYGALDMHVGIDFHIGILQDVYKAHDIIMEAAASCRYTYLNKPIKVLVSQEIIESYFCIKLRCKVYVLDTKYEKPLVSDITLRVLDAFRKNKILPPTVLERRSYEKEGT